MAATYRLGCWRRVANVLVRALLRWGLGPPRTYLLTVRGRVTGRPHSTPVTLVEEGGLRWLVAPYGEVGWVRNARAAGEVMLSRGSRSERVTVFELEPAEAAPILRRYLTQVPITRPFFDVRPASGLDTFAAEAPRHPVFRIVRVDNEPP
ncbi:MAG TPA: nitroreductase family deazaflavin-dependent oxidoreductase [Methylomirabilota bacterium]|nr:nitroreductase family deazaflavin-dependent oxidoreductase [Methylomirabilota bacterium]